MAPPMTDVRARKYSVEEILSLRGSLPVVNCAVEKLNKHPDTGNLRVLLVQFTIANA